MGNADRNAQGKETASSKRDWNLYKGGGSGGSGSATVSSATRYTFWVDYSKFDTFIRRLIVQNVSFEIWKDSLLTQPAAFYIDVGQTNDKPDALIRGSVTSGSGVNNSVLIDSATTPPPYFININVLTQPADANFQADQGRWNYNQYTSNGLGTGTSTKIVQSFIPSSPFLTGLKFKDIFHAATNSDHTTYNNLIFEVWDTNKNVLKSFSLSPYKDAALAQIGNGWGSQSWVTADDGLVYWVDFKDLVIPFAPYVQVVPGQTHYFCVKQDVSSVAHHYGIGSNTTNTGVWDGDTSHYYINGQAFTAPYASTVLTAIGTNISTCFLTLRNNGRTGITFLWDSSAYYWYDPTLFLDQFRFVKADTDKRI